MLFTIGLFFLLLSPGIIHGQSDAEIDAAIANVQEYLRQSSTKSSSNDVSNEALQNSNKIGLGYNPILGSPVCYTGDCQMEGFARPIFKLDYSKRPTGSCTNKLIPNYTDLDCLPSSAIIATTEIINTVEKIFENTVSGLDISASASYYYSSFSYKYSTQTRSMIDTVVRANSTVLYTNAKISCFKLSSFPPMMELSDNFRYVITRLPCCSYSSKVKSYIYENIFNYFGFTYVKDVLLGGITQQKITITEEDRTNLIKNDFSTSNSALAQIGGFIFSASVSLNQSQQFTEEKVNTFKRYSEQNSVTRLGGDSSIQSIEEWSKTVPSNPIIIKFGISSIFDLLNEDKFPDDKNISLKSNLIEKALNEYIDNPVFCYKNCTNGTCKSSGYFQFGLCQCNPGYTGFDCSQTLTPKSPVLAGTLCGLSAPNRGVIMCENNKNSNVSGFQCGSGYVSQNNFITSLGNGDDLFMTSCFKTQETNQFSPVGTLCGFATAASQNPLNVNCDGRHPYNQGCPKGYEQRMLGSWTTCVKIIENQDDLPGTLCGMHTHKEYNYGLTDYAQYRCNGYDVENGYCPPGYGFAGGRSSFSYVNQIADLRVLNFCYKQ